MTSVVTDLGLPIHQNFPAAAVESRELWSRSWVAVGVEDAIPGLGDVLPATVGDHGVHVQRGADGTLSAGYNALQQGSCWNIPSQCGNGSKVGCAYVSCGHSRDGDALPATADSARLIRQIVGARPGKRIQIPLRRVGRVLFVGLPGHDLGPLEQQLGIDVGAVEDSFTGKSFLGRFRIEYPCNWRDFGSQIEHALEAAHARELKLASVHLGMPNVVVIDSTVTLTVLCAKPVNQGRIEISIACYGEAGAEFAAIESMWRRILEGRASVRFDPETSAATWANKMVLHAETAG